MVPNIEKKNTELLMLFPEIKNVQHAKEMAKGVYPLPQQPKKTPRPGMKNT
ncbi:MAG: hypothetical protein BTN85_1333 [Candidatus Methanohalarchaeum thermophilum]|uniref:Uncharacterized protein n=1 Tax=Methanohalarchaeum thermophilum TaxID=1903181 RepID=A0A1Q6DWR4_METT1|nr:MAG: hypothetical protein BTN85_1333 [Candidatus Methanohalarchaeum thermophilum]